MLECGAYLSLHRSGRIRPDGGRSHGLRQAGGVDHLQRPARLLRPQQRLPGALRAGRRSSTTKVPTRPAATGPSPTSSTPPPSCAGWWKTPKNANASPPAPAATSRSATPMRPSAATSCAGSRRSSCAAARISAHPAERRARLSAAGGGRSPPAASRWCLRRWWSPARRGRGGRSRSLRRSRCRRGSAATPRPPCWRLPRRRAWPATPAGRRAGRGRGRRRR